MTNIHDGVFFSQDEMYSRRKKLAYKIWEMSNKQGGLILLNGNEEIIRKGDMYYPFCQEPNFLYLTTFQKPGAIFVMRVHKDKTFKTTLYIQECTTDYIYWNGPQDSLQEIKKKYYFDECLSKEKFYGDILSLLIEKHLTVYSLIDNKSTQWNNYVQSLIGEVRKQTNGVKDIPLFVPSLYNITQVIEDFRTIKSEEEINELRTVAQITCSSHKKIIKNTKHYVHERELEAKFVSEMIKNDTNILGAFPPLITNGENISTKLHNSRNNQALKKQGMIICDTGAEQPSGYAGDITSTFPRNGKFSKEQKIIYELVLKAQTEAIKHLKEGNVFSKPHDISITIITKGLINLGILKGDIDEMIEYRLDHSNRNMKELIWSLTPHNIMHHIGICVHDAGSTKGETELKSGMVLCLEPGLYIPFDKRIHPKWHHIATRIEDMILITKGEPEILSSTLKRDTAYIESLMN